MKLFEGKDITMESHCKEPDTHIIFNYRIKAEIIDVETTPRMYKPPMSTYSSAFLDYLEFVEIPRQEANQKILKYFILTLSGLLGIYTLSTLRFLF